jgi:serine/threonine protein kinase
MAQESTHYLDRASGAPRWTGTERYEVVGTLGEGGMGVVYEAFDRERKQAIAVKTLLRFDASTLYLFKQEFRTLADVRHTNLVHLFELVVPDEGHVFFTMELVRGIDFRAYVQRESKPMQSGTIASARPADRVTLPPHAARETSRRKTTADIDRLRPALRQLVTGVQALHTAGRLHRDIKPSNVLVTPEGRVVLLDFGVATELAQHGDNAGDGEMVGTARYMAPEQACDEPPTLASDWYSVGVVLYEALVGRPPFMGSSVDVLTMKTTMDAELASAVVEGVPPDLDALCTSLLCRDPSGRPSGEEILRRLGVTASAPPPAMPVAPTLETSLVGREAHLLALRESLEVVRAGRSVAVHISGAPGMGKSTVAHAFLDDLGRTGAALVLRSRAYERESVPYKAVDSAIDALSKHLMRLADGESPPRLPADTWALAKLFPVLQRVPMPPPPAVTPVEDPQALRQRAFHALMAILALLAKDDPIVLFIDDAQWGDVDSAALLLELMRSPEAPPVLLCMTHRTEEAETSPLLAELRDRWPETLLVSQVDVGPLSFDDAQSLALALLGSSDDGAKRTARAVARESRGSPFLVEELVRSNRVLPSGEGPTLAVLTLDQMVSERLERLAPSTRALLEVTAVGGRPMEVSVVADAARSSTADEDVAVGVARRFLRAGLRDGRDVIEMTHDRIRETIVARLSDADLRKYHRRLATALQDAADGDAEGIATHWLLAGDQVRAAEYAESAAEQAATKLAFDQAARLMALAIDNTEPDAPSRRRLRLRLGALLKNCGRAVESARVFQGLVAGASRAEQVEYQRIAAEQLLVAGSIDEGTELLHGVLQAVGVKAPRSPVSAVFWLVVYRLWLVVLGLHVRDRRPGEVSPDARARIEALFTATSGFSIVDVVLSACMQARHLVEALRFGDRFQVLRAVSFEAAHLAAQGKRESARELRLVAMARDLVARDGTAEADAYFAGARGIGLFQRGRWREAAELLERGQKATLHALVGFSTVRMFSLYAGFFLGEIAQSRVRLARLCADADARGDRYTSVNVRTSVAVHVSLSVDDPSAARRGPREALMQWTQKGFHVQHWQAMVYGPDADVYAGAGAEAYERFARDLRPLRRSLLLHAGFIRAMTFFTRGRYAIAAIASPGGEPKVRRARIAEALRMARRLDREFDGWTAGLAAMVRACAHNAAGQQGQAIAALRVAIARNEATECLAYVEPVRYRLGQMLGGQEGRELRARALEAMGAQGVKNPDRWAATFMPGTWEAKS